MIAEQQVTSAEITNRQQSTLSTDSLPETGVTKKPIHSDTSKSTFMNNDAPLHDVATQANRGMHMNYSRLPKLPLPTFDSNPLEWQTFWNSFSAAVDSNPNLTGIQKFNYLRAQLQGDALCVISGFPLSNNNYSHSIELLKARFGQKHKLVEAHMDALLNIPPRSDNLVSLQTFYDILQSHIRALSALGESSQSYGPL